MSDPLNDAGRAALIAAGWAATEGRDAVTKRFTFGDFVEAFGFMTKAAIWAEKLGHHPEWSNVYRTVDIALTTHDIGGLSDLDLKLARKLDDLAQ